MADNPTPWRTVKQVATRWQTGTRAVYRAIASGHLRAARIGGRRALRIHDDWADEALRKASEPIGVNR